MQNNITVLIIWICVAFIFAMATVYLFMRNRELKKQFHNANHRYASGHELLIQENRSLQKDIDTFGRAGAEAILIDYCLLYGQEVRRTVDSAGGPLELVFKNAIIFDQPVELKHHGSAVSICYTPDEDHFVGETEPVPGRHPGLQCIVAADGDRAAEKTEPVDALENYHILVDAIQESQTCEG